ncbi:hypothetical protein ATANTOWER_021590 [Ataeniobius toweri]|uniref:Uncharacterized protein n=1 Tax=Ataeniobius toweri TaxID=208326 RepID=A0ABU7BRJ3_9TELE|nr:hypothetical protein [Ataeniobius toweri]
MHAGEKKAFPLTHYKRNLPERGRLRFVRSRNFLKKLEKYCWRKCLSLNGPLIFLKDLKAAHFLVSKHAYSAKVCWVLNFVKEVQKIPQGEVFEFKRPSNLLNRFKRCQLPCEEQL